MEKVSSLREAWRTILALWDQRKEAKVTGKDQKEEVAEGHVSTLMPPLAVRRGMHAHGVFHHLLCGVPSACVEETHMSDCLVRKVGQLELCHRKPQTAFTCTILLLKAALKWKHIRNAHFLHLQTFIQHSKNSVIRPNLFFP